MLIPRDARIAELRGAGYELAAIAKTLGISLSTVKRVMRNPEAQAAAARARANVADPDAHSTLRAALTATRKDGTPDWQVRVQAAGKLLLKPPAAEDAPDNQPQTIVYAPRARQ